MSKIYIICTGGTLGMTSSPDGMRLAPGHIEDKIRALPISKHPSMPELVFKELELIDSSEMSLSYWNSIADEIVRNYKEYDGFVILHGTDTMSYTGSALSFMLRNISKPIILTGAQTPWEEPVSDARDNIMNSIFIAGNSKGLNEVCIFFNQELFRANRTSKVSTKEYKAYSSLNYPVLGVVGSSVEIHSDVLLPAVECDTPIVTKFEPVDIRTIRITPYLSVAALSSVLNEASAVILETYGDGNMQTKEEFLRLLYEANSRGVILINRSQCPHSMTYSGLYDEGAKLAGCGVISAGDQTIETILAKLTFLFNCPELGRDLNRIKKLMIEDICGELTAPPISLPCAHKVVFDHRQHTSPIRLSLALVPEDVLSSESMEKKLSATRTDAENSAKGPIAKSGLPKVSPVLRPGIFAQTSDNLVKSPPAVDSGMTVTLTALH